MRLFRVILGKVLGGLAAAATAVLMIGLLKMQVLPTKLIVLAGVVFLLLTALVFVLTWTGRGKVRMSVGIVLAVLLIGVLTLGSVYAWQTVRALNKSAGDGTETVYIGIYMRADDARKFDEASAAGYQYGILQTIGRETTDGAVQRLNERLKTKISCKEYKSAAELVNGLLDGQVDAIILDRNFLEILADLPGYGQRLSQIREEALERVQVQVDQTENNNKNPEVETKPVAKGDPFIVYISGIDTTGKVSVRSRSDVNILAVVNPETRQILLVSTPRDYFVPLSVSKGIPDKLTHAGNFGVNVSKDTMSMLYDIDIDYYFKVNFSGFKKVVDALGGVTVQSDYAFSTEMNGVYYNFKKGENQLNGQEALVFCRVRKAFADGDHQRGKNQMALIKGVINKAMSPALLTNYTQILKAIEGNVEMSIPTEVIANLVDMQLSDGGAWNVVSYSVSGTSGWEIPYSLGDYASIIYPDEKTVNHAKEMIRDVLDGKTVTP